MNFLLVVYDGEYIVNDLQGDDDGQTRAKTAGLPPPS